MKVRIKLLIISKINIIIGHCVMLWKPVQDNIVYPEVFEKNINGD